MIAANRPLTGVPQAVAGRLGAAGKARQAPAVWAVVVFVAAGIISVWFLLRAAGTPDLPSTLVLVGGGGATGAVGLVAINKPISALVADRPRIMALAGLVVMAFGAWLVVRSFAAESGLGAALGMIALMIGILPLAGWLDSTDIPLPGLWWLIGLALVGLGMLSLGQFTVGDTELTGWLGWSRERSALLALAGLTLIKVTLPRWLDRPRLIDPSEASDWFTARNRVAARVGFWAAAIGVAAMTLAARAQNLAVFLAGGVAVGVGLTVYALAGQRVRSWPNRWWLTLVVGAVLVGVGGWRVRAVLGEWDAMILVLVAALVATGAWFVFRGEGLFVLVLAGFVFAWVLHDRTVPVPEPAIPDDGPLLLALGDSYTAGQGDHEFWAANNTLDRTEGNPCRRSPNAYPELVGASLEMGVINLACSGADIDNLTHRPQHPGSNGFGAQSQLTHLAQLPDETRDRIEVVVLSVGGNDVGFGTLIPACLLPADCAQSEAFWLARARQVEGDLTELYRRVADAVPGAQIVPVPYPQLLDDTSCGLAVGDRERPFIVAFTKTLNASVVRAADQVRSEGKPVMAFPHSFDALRLSNRLLCDEGRQGVNFIHLLPHEGSAAQRLAPVHWKDGSLHPRAEGHAEIAAVLHPWLAAGIDDRFVPVELDHASLDLTPAERAMAEPTPAEVTDAGTEEGDGSAVPADGGPPAGDGALVDDGPPAGDSASLDEVAAAADPDESLRREREAVNAQAWATASQATLAGAALMVGGLFMALASIQLWPRWRRLMAPLRHPGS